MLLGCLTARSWKKFLGSHPVQASGGLEKRYLAPFLSHPALDHALLSMVHLDGYFLRFNKASRSANGL